MQSLDNKRIRLLDPMQNFMLSVTSKYFSCYVEVYGEESSPKKDNEKPDKN